MTQGFYYDAQKNNKKTSISLHANSEKGSDGKWVAWSGETFQDTPGEWKYGTKAICSGILNEDFGVSLTNNWGENNGGNAIEGAWNDLFRPFSPYIKEIGKGVSSINNNKHPNEENSTFVDKIQNFLDWGGQKLDKYGGYLDWALVVQGFRFTFYSGSSTVFKNLGMKFTLFPDWENGKLVTVHDQLKRITPYVYGEFLSISEAGKQAKENSPEEGEWYDKLAETIKDFGTEYISWQKPPAGFRTDTKSIDIVQEGTLRLNIGLSYCIENLVISDCSVEFSKTMAKMPDPSSPSGIKITPLYADVTLQLQPATMFSDKSFTRFSSGVAMSTVLEKEQEDLNKKMKEQMKKYNSKK